MSFKVGDKVMWDIKRKSNNPYEIIAVHNSRAWILGKNGIYETVHIRNLRPYCPLKVGWVVEARSKNSKERYFGEVIKVDGSNFSLCCIYGSDGKPYQTVPDIDYSPETVQVLLFAEFPCKPKEAENE